MSKFVWFFFFFFFKQKIDSLKTSLSQRKAETVIFREVWVTGERTCVKEILSPNLVTPDEATPSILPVIHKSQGGVEAI